MEAICHQIMSIAGIITQHSSPILIQTWRLMTLHKIINLRGKPLHHKYNRINQWLTLMKKLKYSVQMLAKGHIEIILLIHSSNREWRFKYLKNQKRWRVEANRTAMRMYFHPSINLSWPYLHQPSRSKLLALQEDLHLIHPLMRHFINSMRIKG